MVSRISIRHRQDSAHQRCSCQSRDRPSLRSATSLTWSWYYERGRRRMTGNRRRRRTMRIFFETYGDGPWTCEQCGDPIENLGRRRYDGNVHHRDDDKSNDAPENLVVLHVVCHLRLHSPSPEARIKISQTLKGRPSPTKGMKFSAETNAKKSRPGSRNGFYGKSHDEEALKKMRQPRRRERCSGCDRDYAINWIERHKCQT